MRNNLFQKFTCPHEELVQVNRASDPSNPVFLRCLRCNQIFDAKLKIPKGTKRVFLSPSELREMEFKLQPEAYASHLRGEPIAHAMKSGKKHHRFQKYIRDLHSDYPGADGMPGGFVTAEPPLDEKAIRAKLEESLDAFNAMSPKEQDELLKRNKKAIQYEIENPLFNIKGKMTKAEVEEVRKHFGIHKNDGTAEATERVGSAPIAKTTFPNEELKRMEGHPVLMPEGMTIDRIEPKKTEEETMEEKNRERFELLYETNANGHARKKTLRLEISGPTMDAIKENLYDAIKQYVGPRSYSITNIESDVATPAQSTRKYNGKLDVHEWEQDFEVTLRITGKKES